jgi:hypothetical protein
MKNSLSGRQNPVLRGVISKPVIFLNNGFLARAEELACPENPAPRPRQNPVSKKKPGCEKASEKKMGTGFMNRL